MPSAAALNDFDGLLNWPNLQDWIAASELAGVGPITAVEQLTGGSQNNIFKLTREGAQMVLRRPPTHLRSNSNDTMLREARVLGAIKDSGVPHPQIFGSCADTDVIGTTFYVMEAIEGFTPSGVLPAPWGSETSFQSRLGFELVEGIAKLAAVDASAVGLDDFGKRENWVERQVGRWRSQLDGYGALDGYGVPDIPNVDRVSRWIEVNQPASCEIGIIHGDFQFANVMLAHRQPKLAAIVDWELSTLGDPMLDLAWLMQAWPEPTDPPGKMEQVRPWANMVSRSELVAHYATMTGRDVSNYPWYFALACYKLGILLEGTHARACAGKAPKEMGDVLHGYTLWLFATANQWIESL